MTFLNRRIFLLALIAAGAPYALPPEPSEATVNKLWAGANSNPWYFDVDDLSTILDPDTNEPEVWGDVFDIPVSLLKTSDEVRRSVANYEPLRSHFQTLASAELESVQEDLDTGSLSNSERERLRRLAKSLNDEDDGWEEWIRLAGRAGVQRFRDEIEAWLDEPINWMEAESFPADFGAQGQALTVFQQLTAETRESLRVVIVEGERPGSTYWAAELRWDVEAANTRAFDLGLPIRFRQKMPSRETVT